MLKRSASIIIVTLMKYRRDKMHEWAGRHTQILKLFHFAGHLTVPIILFSNITALHIELDKTETILWIVK